MEDKLVIIKKVKILINNLDKIIINIPRKSYYNGDYIMKYSFEVLENIILCNYYTDNNIRVNFYNIIMTKLDMLIFILEIYLNYKYISNRYFVNTVNNINEIKRMIRVWIYGSKNG